MLGPRKPGVPSRQEMYATLKQRSLDLQRLGQDEVDRLEREGLADEAKGGVMSDTRPSLICLACRQDVTAAARLNKVGAENAALRKRCERAEEAQTHLIYLFDCGKISLPETREIVERLKQQSVDAKEQA